MVTVACQEVHHQKKTMNKMIAQTSLIALNDSKRYHGKLKQKNNDQKQEDEQVNKKIASFV
jgi:hypothetical protein